MYKVIASVFICLTLISCVKKNEDLHPYIDTIKKDKINCYRVVDVRETLFGPRYVKGTEWKCEDGSIVFVK